jgi:hypothetical protein
MNDNRENVIFSINLEDLQEEAVRHIKRKLTDDEVDTAKKCIEWGLYTGIDIVFKSAIDEAVKQNR